jgi:organic radical activating enzyme
LIAALHQAGFEVGVESNGTLVAPEGIDWLCISPKGTAKLLQTSGHELKLVYPQVETEAQPEQFVGLQFEHYFLQPLDDPELATNTRRTIEYCLAHPRWKLSLQTHKILGIA